jgi:hypothetical protein
MSQLYKNIRKGDPILAADLNDIQSKIHNHILNHTHDSAAPPDIGTLLAGQPLAIGALSASDTLVNGSLTVAGPSKLADTGVDGALTVGGSTSLNGSVALETAAVNQSLTVNGKVGIGTSDPRAELDVNGEIRAPFFRAGQGSARQLTVPGWYRIAQHPGHWANAEFSLRDLSYNRGRSSLTFRIGSNMNLPDGISFTLLSHSRYQPVTFTKVRLVTSATTIDAPHYVEVYADPGGYPSTFEYSIYDNLHTNAPHSSGWQPVSWEESPALPDGYAAYEFAVDKLFVVGDTASRLSVDRGGNVGIGQESPQARLHVRGGVTGALPPEAPATSQEQFGLYVEEHAAAKQWHTTSDARVKLNPTPVDPARSLQTLASLTLYEYEYIPEYQAGPPGRKYHGFLAQEVENVIPEAVSIVGHRQTGGPAIDGLRVVAYDRIFSEAVGAIQALHSMLQRQEARIHELEERLIAKVV